jgi:CubicO group peptidase (beta-lactamase class C family)
LKERSGFGWAAIGIKVDPGKPTTIVAVDIDQAPTPSEARPVREDQAALAKDVDQLLQKLTADDRFSGVVLIAKDGKPVFAKAYGYADREKKIPNNVYPSSVSDP